MYWQKTVKVILVQWSNKEDNLVLEMTTKAGKNGKERLRLEEAVKLILEWGNRGDTRGEGKGSFYGQWIW